MKNAYERFLEEICSNCKDKERKDCEIRKKQTELYIANRTREQVDLRERRSQKL